MIKTMWIGSKKGVVSYGITKVILPEEEKDARHATEVFTKCGPKWYDTCPIIPFIYSNIKKTENIKAHV